MPAAAPARSPPYQPAAGSANNLRHTLIKHLHSLVTAAKLGFQQRSEAPCRRTAGFLTSAFAREHSRKVSCIFSPCANFQQPHQSFCRTVSYSHPARFNIFIRRFSGFQHSDSAVPPAMPSPFPDTSSLSPSRQRSDLFNTVSVRRPAFTLHLPGAFQIPGFSHPRRASTHLLSAPAAVKSCTSEFSSEW